MRRRSRPVSASSSWRTPCDFSASSRPPTIPSARRRVVDSALVRASLTCGTPNTSAVVPLRRPPRLQCPSRGRRALAGPTSKLRCPALSVPIPLPGSSWSNPCRPRPALQGGRPTWLPRRAHPLRERHPRCRRRVPAPPQEPCPPDGRCPDLLRRRCRPGKTWLKPNRPGPMPLCRPPRSLI